MTDLGPALATLVVVAVALAGCIGGGSSPSGDVVQDGDGEPGAGTGPSDGDPADDAPGETLRFDAGTVDVTHWNNGSFAPQDAYLPAGFAQGIATGEYPGRAVVDVTADVPADVPVRVTAQATYPSDSTGFMFFALDGEGFETYTLDTDSQGHYDPATSEAVSTLDSTLVRGADGTVRVRLSYSTPDPATSVDYTFRASVRADPAAAPGDVPVAFPVEDPSEPITLRPAAAEPGTSVTLWGPDDGTVAKVDLSGPQEIELPDDASAGEYVVLADDHPGVAVSAPGGGTFRALATEATITMATSEPAHAGSATGSMTWSFEVPTAPVAVGIAIQPGSNADTALFSRPSGIVSSPEGQAFAFESVGTYLAVSAEAWTSDLGGSALVPGTYEASFSADAAANVEVGHVIVEYVR